MPSVTVARISRITVPAVGKVGRPSAIGMMSPLVVSPAARTVVKATPDLFVPVVDSLPAAFPSTVR